MIPIITACLFGALATAVVMLMKWETNKRLKSHQPEDIDFIDAKPYASNVSMWGLLIGIIVLSSITGYIVSIKAVSPVAIIELGICYFAALAAAVIDFKTRTIPNYIPIALVLVRLLIFVYELIYVNSAISYFISSLIGGFLCMLLLVIANKVSKGGIGGGDIKLLASIGFVCGLYVVFSTLLLALVCCIIVSGVLLTLKKCSTKDHLPFGPFIFVGYLAMCLLTLY